MSQRAARQLTAAVLILILSTTACGGDDAEDAAEDAVPATLPLLDEPPVEEMPDPVGLTSLLTPDDSASIKGLEAASLFVNDAGGLGGEAPIELRLCVEASAGALATCVQNQIDGGVLAAVGSQQCDGAGYGMLSASGLANVGPAVCSTVAAVLENSFVMGHGPRDAAALQSLVACSLFGSEVTSLIGADTSAVRNNSAAYDAALAEQGCSPTSERVYVNPDSDDFGEAFSGMDEVQVVLVDIEPDQLAGFTRAYRAASSSAVLVFAPGIITDEVTERLDGSLVVRSVQAPDGYGRGFRVFSEYMNRVDGSVHRSDERAMTAFVSVLALDRALRQCDACDVTPEGALEAMRGLQDYDALGLAPVLDFTVPGPDATAPRVPTSEGFLAVIDDGRVVEFGEGNPTG